MLVKPYNTTLVLVEKSGFGTGHPRLGRIRILCHFQKKKTVSGEFIEV